MTGFPIGIENLMVGWGMLVIPQGCQIPHVGGWPSDALDRPGLRAR